MALTPSQRPTREWPLLVLALALVCAVCIPLWQWSSGRQLAFSRQALGAAVGPAANLLEPVSPQGWSKWTWQRVRSLLRFSAQSGNPCPARCAASVSGPVTPAPCQSFLNTMEAAQPLISAMAAVTRP